MRHTPCGCCPTAAPEAWDFSRAECAKDVSAPFSLRGKDCRGGRLCPPLAVKRKRQRGICVGTNSTSLALPQAAGLVRFVVPPFPARIASLDSRGSPFFGIPLTRPRRGLMPPSWINPRGWFVQSAFQATKKHGADANWIDRRGSRNTLRLFRLPYVKYSTGANLATRIFYRALRKPDSTVARRAFLNRWCNEKT